NMGVLFSKLLVADPIAAKKTVISCLRRMQSLVSIDKKAGNEERFWLAICGAILAGTEYANKLGAGLNAKLIENYLVVTYNENRQFLVESNVEGGNSSRTDEHLAGFLKECSGNTLWVNQSFSGRGRPKT